MFSLTLPFNSLASLVHISFSFAIISRPTATSAARIRRDGTMEIMRTYPTLMVCLISMASSGRTYDRSLPGYPTHEHPHHLLRPFESHTTWKGPRSLQIAWPPPSFHKPAGWQGSDSAPTKSRCLFKADAPQPSYAPKD